jgi:hypothetical protein
MRAAFALFAPFRGIPKVTIFGSARTAPTTSCTVAAAAARLRSPTRAGWS